MKGTRIKVEDSLRIKRWLYGMQVQCYKILLVPRNSAIVSRGGFERFLGSHVTYG